MSETTFEVGDRVRVAADAEDVWFGGEVEGVVIENDLIDPRYDQERRVNVVAPCLDYDGEPLAQYVRPEDLTLITSDN